MKIKKLKNWKKYSEKNPTKLSWFMSAKSNKKKIIQKEKKTQNYHGPCVPNLIPSFKALYITK